MSAITGPNYSVDNQISFIVQWFRTWSELQKDDFVEILAQRLTPGNNMNGLVNGMQNLDTGTKRVSLFSCQMKLFNEWWTTWSDPDKEKLTARLKDSDPKFWATVQEELNGTRKKVEDDFFLTINTCVTSSGTNEQGEEEEVGQIEETAEPQQAVVTVNGVQHDEEEESNPVINQNGMANGNDARDDVEVEEDEGMEADGPSG